MRDIQMEPVMFKLSQDYMKASGVMHEEGKIQEEQELFQRKKAKAASASEDVKDVHYAMYFQDRKKAYFVFRDSSQNVEMSLRIEGTSAIQNSYSGYNASSDNFSQMGSPKQSMQSFRKAAAPGQLSEQLTIVSFFFGMSESEDSAIIFSKFNENVRDGNSGAQSLLKTQVISISQFFSELRKSVKGKFNPYLKEHGVLRTTDFFVPDGFYVDN